MGILLLHAFRDKTNEVDGFVLYRILMNPKYIRCCTFIDKISNHNEKNNFLPDELCKRVKTSVSDSDPDSIRSLDKNPDSDSESGSGSGSRRAKMTHKNRKS
jgi:hypothetical protein